MQPQIALVTGAGAGIGMSVARALARENFRVYAGVRNLKRAIKDYKNDPPNIIPVLLDVNKQNHISKTVTKITTTDGRIDILVNNAGFGMYGVFEELTNNQIREQLETNYFACLQLCRAVIPGMKKRSFGKIINISSVLGFQALPTGTAYTSSKFALEGFSESLRYELFIFGIHVSLIEPGLIETNFKKNIQFSKQSANLDSEYHFLNQMMNREYQGISTTSSKAAKKIVKIINKKKPKVRYRIGLDCHLIWLLQKTTPMFLRDWIMKKYIRSLVKKQ